MKKYPAFLKTYGPYFIFIASEIGLYLSFQHHDARFHWFLHFFVGASAALLVMSTVTWLRCKPVSFPLLWILVGHFFATFPDILFTFFSVLHEQWMDVFLFHISVHFVPGRNFTWYSIFLISLGIYLYTTNKNKVSSRLNPGTSNNSPPTSKLTK